MLNCQRATRLLSDAQERNLTFTERMNLQMHTVMCSGCRNFERQMQTLRRITRAYAKSDIAQDE